MQRSLAAGLSMPTSLPERRTEFFPSRRQIIAMGAAMAVMIALIAFHARFKTWVSDALRAEFVIPAPPSDG
jgi:hypothetical protein